MICVYAKTQSSPSARARFEGPRPQNRVRFFGTRKLMLGGVAAVFIARPGTRREIALYCEINAPSMSRRTHKQALCQWACPTNIAVEFKILNEGDHSNVNEDDQGVLCVM